MTGENRADNIAAEWQRTQESLRAARVLLDAGLFNDAMSRAYYAVFHAATCLLLTQGIEARSHRGMIRLVHQHFVRPGRFAAAAGRSLAQMQKYREEADYDPFVVFDAESAAEEIGKAESFVSTTAKSLRADGWLPDEG